MASASSYYKMEVWNGTGWTEISRFRGMVMDRTANDGGRLTFITHTTEPWSRYFLNDAHNRHVRVLRLDGTHVDDFVVRTVEDDYNQRESIKVQARTFEVLLDGLQIKDRLRFKNRKPHLILNDTGTTVPDDPIDGNGANAISIISYRQTKLSPGDIDTAADTSDATNSVGAGTDLKEFKAERQSVLAAVKSLADKSKCYFRVRRESASSVYIDFYNRISGGNIRRHYGSTTVSSNTLAASTSLPVTDASAFAANDRIVIGTGSKLEIRTISSISNNTLTLSTATTYAHSAGEDVGHAGLRTSDPSGGVDDSRVLTLGIDSRALYRVQDTDRINDKVIVVGGGDGGYQNVGEAGSDSFQEAVYHVPDLKDPTALANLAKTIKGIWSSASRGDRFSISLFRDPVYSANFSADLGETIAVQKKETTLSADAAAGATSISVKSARHIVAGDSIVIGLGAASQERRTVSSVSGNTVTLSSGLTNAWSSGATVGFLFTGAFIKYQYRQADEEHDIQVAYLGTSPGVKIAQAVTAALREQRHVQGSDNYVPLGTHVAMPDTGASYKLHYTYPTKINSVKDTHISLMLTAPVQGSGSVADPDADVALSKDAATQDGSDNVANSTDSTTPSSTVNATTVDGVTVDTFGGSAVTIAANDDRSYILSTYANRLVLVHASVGLSTASEIQDVHVSFTNFDLPGDPTNVDHGSIAQNVSGTIYYSAGCVGVGLGASAMGVVFYNHNSFDITVTPRIHVYSIKSHDHTSSVGSHGHPAGTLSVSGIVAKLGSVNRSSYTTLQNGSVSSTMSNGSAPSSASVLLTDVKVNDDGTTTETAITNPDTADGSWSISNSSALTIDISHLNGSLAGRTGYIKASLVTSATTELAGILSCNAEVIS